MRFFVFSLVFMFCSTVYSSGAFATNFVIKKGGHESSPRSVQVFNSTGMSFSARFDKSAVYEFSGSAANDQYDINKLYGFSDCLTDHMKNSARFGWNWVNGQLQIHAFVHRDGKFYYKKIGVAHLDRFYDYNIKLSSDRKKYVFSFNGQQVEMERGCSKNKATGYRLYPYFGGNQVAPHKITIELN
jgi:hypothetical protein